MSYIDTRELIEERDELIAETEIPDDHPVQPLDDDEPAEDRVTCGNCGRSWDDAIVTGMTPVPSGRCPFESWTLTDEDAERVSAINALLDEVGDEARYGVTLIPESEFEDYARELAEDIGAIPPVYSWPASHIDWEAAADALRMDYSSVTFDGSDYLFCS